MVTSSSVQKYSLRSTLVENNNILLATSKYVKIKVQRNMASFLLNICVNKLNMVHIKPSLNRRKKNDECTKSFPMLIDLNWKNSVVSDQIFVRN